MYKYLITCACFNCRKCFKRNLSEHNFDSVNVPICPNCGKITTVLGRKFRAPKKNNLNEWKKVEILLRAGFIVGFHSIEGLSNYPTKLNQTPEFIRTNWQKRCHDCMSYVLKNFGEYPLTEKDINLFITRWF